MALSTDIAQTGDRTGVRRSRLRPTKEAMMRPSIRIALFTTLFVQSAALGASDASAQSAAVTQNDDRVAETAPVTNTQDWTASAGAVLNTGNTRSYSFNGGTAFSITRGRNQFSFTSAGNFGKSDPDEPDPTMQDHRYISTSRNVISRARYDFFMARQHAIFTSLGHRWDTFSGLDARVQWQVGYQYNFIREEKHRLWAEAGYDLTFDNIHGQMDENVTYHSARFFAGWDHHVSEAVAFKTGLEGLFNVMDGADWRVNWENTLTSHINGNFSIELKFNLYYDHQPVVVDAALNIVKERTDTRTTLNLVLDMW